MKYNNCRASCIGVFALSAWFFSGTVSAECLANVDPNIDSEMVTPYGGSALSCPTGYSTCTINDVFDGAECTGIVNQDGSTSIIRVAVDEENRLNWTSYDEVSGEPNVIQAGKFGGIDAVFRTNSTGGQGCAWSFGTDQVTGKADFLKSNGTFMPAKAISFCSDMKQEFTAAPPPPPAEVEQCLLATGQSKVIHGVTFSCPDVPAGETRTVLVAEMTTNCEDTGDVDPETGFPIFLCESNPGFGFTDETGNIDFNNVCQCIGPLESMGGITPVAPVTATECDPDPANAEGGCEVGAGAEVPAGVTFQNQTCFTIGGFRRCF